MKKNYFYIIKESYFGHFPDPYLKGNKSQSRPHYYCIKDTKEEIFWMIPLSSQIEKYKRIMSKLEADRKRCDTLHILELNKVESVFVIQDMFPITKEYIERYYTINKQPLKLVRENHIKEIDKKAKRILALLKQGRKLMKTSPDVLTIYQQLIAQLDDVNKQINILITGANGQLGQELQKQLQQLNGVNQPYKIIPTDYNTMDITDLSSVQTVFQVTQPHIIINCAAHTAVDKCEEDIEGAYKINSIGPRNLAIECDKIGAKLIQISTDYVFSGEFNASEISEPSNNYEQKDLQGIDEVLAVRQEKAEASMPWREDSPLDPKSIYGTSKLAGEEHVRIFCKKHFIIRTAWLYGEGNNFVRTMIKLAETNKELSVVADQFGNPTSTKDLATTIINLMHTENYGTYHGTCEGTCSWYDFACKIFEIKGIAIKVNPVTSEEFPRPAKRPHYSSLDNFMLKLHGMNTFRIWEEALADYLSEK